MDFTASRDVIIRTDNFDEATKFYEHVIGLAIAYKSETLYGFDAGLPCTTRTEERGGLAGCDARAGRNM
jgi:hypothetical protein